jgi:pyruvate/2-oxoglutarate dehydrogenase complex dihydrolipoamide acyltransferase (E2) component
VSPSSPITPLASSQIDHHHISVELIETVDAPPAVLIRWPDAPTVVDPKRFPDVAAAVARLFAEAATRLAASKRTGDSNRAGRQGIQDFVPPPPDRPANKELTETAVQQATCTARTTLDPIPGL